MAGGSMKDIKRRIKSVESTGQITKAMELVASSKLRRAKERAGASRPFFDTLYSTICDISAANIDLESVYVGRNNSNTCLLVIIAGDRGLAGGYNANIFRMADADILRLKSEGKQVEIIAIGKKAAEYYEKRENTVLESFIGVAEDIDYLRVNVIGKLIVDGFASGSFGDVYLYYTEFISALSQDPQRIKMLPLADLNEGSEGGNPQFVEYEPSPVEVFDLVVPSYINGMLFGAITESYASEQGARRTAMEAANDNAADMIEKLSLKYNRARQAAITQEISEIVSGANAAG